MNEQIKRKYLLLFYQDAGDLLERLTSRREEYLEIFALRRTREHFEKVFFTRYYQTNFSELVHLDETSLKMIHHFYKLVDDLHWYVYSTQDMPGAVGEELDRYLARLAKTFGEFSDHFKEELGIVEVPEVPFIPVNSEIIENEIDEEV